MNQTTHKEEINKIKQEINRTEEKLKKLKKILKDLNDLLEVSDNNMDNKLLCRMPGFPNRGPLWIALMAIVNNRKNCHICSSTELTVKDLICTNEKELQSFNGVGPRTLSLLKEWMKENNIEFFRE